jgi:hypothetical protein
MAKKRGSKKRGSKKRGKKVNRSTRILQGADKKRGTGLRKAALTAARKHAIAKRITLHELSSKLASFAGGKLPIKSGCGRPRGS